MKKIILSFLFFCLAGCSTGQEKLRTYLEEPEYLIKDPHFAAYKQQLDNLDREYYLEKKMTYVEYLEKKKEIDAQYEKEVKQRTDVIEGQSQVGENQVK